MDTLNLITAFTVNAHHSDTSKAACELFIKYHKDSLEQFHKQLVAIPQPLDVFTNFKLFLLPSLIGQDLTNHPQQNHPAFKQMMLKRYEAEKKNIHNKYYAYCKAKLEVQTSKGMIIQTYKEILKLCNECFNENIVQNVKLAFLERYAHHSMLKAKLTLMEKQSRDKSQASSHSPNHETHRFESLVIENDQLKQKLSQLRQRRAVLRALPAEKVEQYRRVYNDLKFVENINQSSSLPATEESTSNLSFSMGQLSLSLIE